MQLPDDPLALPRNEPVGGRRHRFMESADVNAVFRQFFGALRRNVRRGLVTEGQLYALEMDACIPGEVLGTDWIPPVSRGFDEPGRLADARQRGLLFDQLLAEARTEALFAYCCERTDQAGGATLYLELVSADARYAASYPIEPGHGWHRRELVMVPHARLDQRALA